MQPETDDFLPTRRSLLSRLRNWEDSQSWLEFFETYWKLIYNTAIKAGLKDDEAQDVVQETMLAISKQMPAFKYDPAIGSFKGFLLKTTRWKILDQLNRVRSKDVGRWNGSQEDSTAALENMPDENLNLDEFWNQEWKKNLVGAAIDRVKKRAKPRQYQLFDLAVNKEWPVPKVVKTMGVSRDEVYMAKHRVSKMIEEEVERLSSIMDGCR